MSPEIVSSYIPSSSTPWMYDVFLSFRGEDTRKSFTDHLYAALNQEGINVFRDDKELERGKSISPELFRAIEKSRFSIIVFSRNYAYSTWCLDELVKIIEWNHTNEQMVFPIFYGVEPTMVRKQTGSFQEAFAKHEKTFRENIERVEKWRMALREAANLCGWELKDRHEVEFIQEIVMQISRRVKPTTLRTFNNLVGMNSRLEKLMTMISHRECNDVRMIGIWGMGGIGKTTIARALYDLISSEFERSAFLGNVREISERDGLIALQKQLLSKTLMTTNIEIHDDFDGIQMIRSKLQHRKVLVIVDDVAHVSQLTKLVGNHNWFGSGSRIIITTRDKHLLTTHRVDKVYEAEALNRHEAFQLFTLKAFGNNLPSKEYVELTDHVLNYAGGLPLALDVLSSFLYGRTVDEWSSALERLNGDSEKEILDILQLSFDGLKEKEKKIFLDIACFFKGEDRDYVTKILDHCGFDPVIGISVLVEKCLITISKENKLWMHDLLEEMGQQIVKRQSLEEPGKRSRLWKEEDVHHVLTKDSGTESVEVIISSAVHLSASAKVFSNMTNLRLLIIKSVQLPEGLEYLSNELRILEWHGYSLKSLPSNSELDKLIELNMCNGRMEQMWEGVKFLNKLKFMRLSHSKSLIRIPDFTGVPNLKELCLEGCTRLHEIHPTLLVHKKLILLNLKDCTNLATLPREISMESLEKLVLSGCTKLKKFPEIVGSMEYLLELFLDGTAIQELPSSIELLGRLILLDLKNCTSLVKIPSTINRLAYLKILILSRCSESKSVPDDLEELDVRGTGISKPVWSISHKEIFSWGCKVAQSFISWSPISLMQRSFSDHKALMLPSLSGLCSLTKLDLSGCNLGDGEIPTDICNLFSLEELNLNKNKFVSLPGTFNRLSKLKHLKLKDCNMLKSLPELPPSIRTVKLDGCGSLEILSDALLKLCKLEFSLIRGVNCLKLLGNNDLWLSILKGFLEGGSNPSRFSIIVPGGKIPEWFHFQTDGCSLTIRPSSLYNKNYKLVGYVLCCHFHVGSPHSCGRSVLSFCMEIDKVESSASFIDFKNKFGQVVSEHLWLFYLPRQEYIGEEFWNEYVHTEVSFGQNQDTVLKVVECGFHPVYAREVVEYNQTTKQSTNIVQNFDEFHQDFSGESTNDVATMSKRSFSYYAGTKDSESGSCSEDCDNFFLKKLKFF